MDDLAFLFRQCAYEVQYQTAGLDVDYAFVEDGARLYIYFKGSDSIWDWISNFMFPAKPYKGMDIPYRVHRGFLRCWKQVEDIVISKITELDPDSGEYRWKEIIIAGYSHGGALSGLCHECCWFHRPDLSGGLIRGYGFESPRFYAGWRVKDSLKDRWAHYTVIRTNEDIVTHCPPHLLRFCHVGKLLKILGDVSLCPNKRLPKCVKSHYPEVVSDALVNLN